MEKIKTLQGELLRHFAFGNTEDKAKQKVKTLSEDCTFLDIGIKANIDNILKNRANFTVLTTFSDMNLISEIREHIKVVKEKDELNRQTESIDKKEFQQQYLDYLTDLFKSRDIALSALKQLSLELKAFGCPLGDYLVGYVTESSRLAKLMSMSRLGILSKILEHRDVIKVPNGL